MIQKGALSSKQGYRNQSSSKNSALKLSLNNSIEQYSPGATPELPDIGTSAAHMNLPLTTLEMVKEDLVEESPKLTLNQRPVLENPFEFQTFEQYSKV